MVITRPVLFTMTGILAIGCTLAILAPPQWGLGELILLAACIVLARERSIARAEVLERRSSNYSFADFADSSTEWFAGSGAYARAGDPHVVRERELALAASGSRPATKARRMAVRQATGSSLSVEQMAHEMLTHAFRQASLK
jgi:hypothetical protein